MKSVHPMFMVRLRLIWFISFLCLVCAGSVALASAQEALTPKRARQTQAIILAWLECTECQAGELKAVVRLGPVAIPSLRASLREGPSPVSREAMRRHLVDSYRRLKRYQAAHPDFKFTQSEADYITHYMDLYVAQYQIRSAKALVAIGGPEAKRALEEIDQVSLNKGVARIVKKSLEKLSQTTPSVPQN